MTFIAYGGARPSAALGHACSCLFNEMISESATFQPCDHGPTNVGAMVKTWPTVGEGGGGVMSKSKLVGEFFVVLGVWKFLMHVGRGLSLKSKLIEELFFLSLDFLASKMWGKEKSSFCPNFFKIMNVRFLPS